MAPCPDRKELESGIGHRQPGTIVKILHVQFKRSILPEVNELIQDQIFIEGLAIWRKAHHLILA
jgi:hypothetical protein